MKARLACGPMHTARRFLPLLIALVAGGALVVALVRDLRGVKPYMLKQYDVLVPTASQGG